MDRRTTCRMRPRPLAGSGCRGRTECRANLAIGAPAAGARATDVAVGPRRLASSVAVLALVVAALLVPAVRTGAFQNTPVLSGRATPIGPPHFASLSTDDPRDLFDQDERNAAAALDRLVGDQLGRERQLGLGPFLVLELADLPLTWEKAPDRVRRSLERAYGIDAADAYERRVARLLRGVLQRLESRRGDRRIGIIGLPQESGPGRDAARTNANYADVIARLGVLASEESFIRVGGRSAVSGVNPRAELRAAWRLREGRPIVFRVNRQWALLDGADDAESAEDRGARIAAADAIVAAADERVEVLLEDGLSAALAIARDAVPRRGTAAERGADRRTVDADAMRRDSDGDGTPDGLDECPDDPNKTEPGDCGCGNPETDRDDDGWPDCIDECPDDPFKREAGDCGCGFSERDADGDGVADCHDGCPGDPFKYAPGDCGCGVPDSGACDGSGGWVPLVPVVGSPNLDDDTRILYVSSTEGRDMRRYRWYAPSDPEVGDDPTMPVGEIEAYRTVQQAMAYLRSDKPDWILVRRGDVFENEVLAWARSGAAPDRPMVLGAWGEPTDRDRPRPVIRTGRGGGLVARGRHPRRHVVVTGLRFEPMDDDARSGPAIDWSAAGGGVVLEDVQVEGYVRGVRLAAPSRGGELAGVRLSRVQLLGPPSGVARSVGVEVEGARDVRIESSLFTASLAAASSGHVHVAFDAAGLGAAVVDCAFIGGAAIACDQSAGGEHRGNLHAGATVALRFGPSSDDGRPANGDAVTAGGGVVANNVIRADAMGPAIEGLVGIRLRDVDGVEVRGNVLAAGVAGTNAAAIELAGRHRDVRVERNRVAAWSSPAAEGTAILVAGTGFGGTTIASNRLEQPEGGALVRIVSAAARPGLAFSGNTAWSASPADAWYEPLGDPRRWRGELEPDLDIADAPADAQLRALAGWIHDVHVRVDELDVRRLDPERFMEPGLAALLVELRRQHRDRWLDDLAPARLAAWVREEVPTAGERVTGAEDDRP